MRGAVIVGLAFSLIAAGAVMFGGSRGSFETALVEMRCEKWVSDKAFDIEFFDRRFPIPRGFNFTGYDMGVATFRMRKKQVLNALSPNSTNTNARDNRLLRQFSSEIASIVLYRQYQFDMARLDASIRVERFDWKGLMVFFWSSEGGRQVDTTVHQSVIRWDDSDEELMITSKDVGLIAGIIACSENWKRT